MAIYISRAAGNPLAGMPSLGAISATPLSFVPGRVHVARAAEPAAPAPARQRLVRATHLGGAKRP